MYYKNNYVYLNNDKKIHVKLLNRSSHVPKIKAWGMPQPGYKKGDIYYMPLEDVLYNLKKGNIKNPITLELYWAWDIEICRCLNKRRNLKCIWRNGLQMLVIEYEDKGLPVYYKNKVWHNMSAHFLPKEPMENEQFLDYICLGIKDTENVPNYRLIIGLNLLYLIENDKPIPRAYRKEVKYLKDHLEG